MHDKASALALDNAYKWEAERANDLWLTQPLGGGEIKTFTWGEAMAEARKMAGHLQSLDLPAGSHIAIFSKNTAWWIIADLAIWMAGHTSIPVFPTLTSDTVRYTLEHSETKLLFVGKLDVWDEAKAGVPEGLDCIAMPLSPKTDYPPWDDLVGAATPMEGTTERTHEETATIVYTSGSTGNPKGAMINFGAMAIAAEGLSEVVHPDASDRMLSYLPLSHVFERWVVEMGSLHSGYQLFFAESLDTFAKDLRRARPTLFVSVPRLWQKFQQGVHAKMNPGKLSLFLKIPILKGIVRKKVLSALGLEECRFAGSGSAPIPADLIHWYRNLGLELLEGYGMTENFCYSHVSRPGHTRVGYVGNAYPAVETRISEAGEIQIKSPGMMSGYYKEPEKTAETFTEDGFLKTGDRGEIDGEGRLRITGRVKELFKTSKGKYVAPAPIENKIQTHPDIESVCVTGSGHPAPHALIVPSPEARKKLSSDEGKAEFAESVQQHVMQINSTLDHHEQLGFVAVMSEDWTIENGFLTPTMKLKRAVIEDTYGSQMDSWYAKKEKVVWV